MTETAKTTDITKYEETKFCDKIIRVRKSDGYLNATEMCKANKKLYGDWYRQEHTKEFLRELASDMDMEVAQIVEVKRGGSRYKQGTWIHPRAATALALWISPKFGVFISKCIEEWKAMSINNVNLYNEKIFNLEVSRSKQLEKKYQEKLHKELGGALEVETPVGFIDLLTEEKIIEIKSSKNWKHAIGQVLCYGNFYKEKKKCIYLFGEIKNIEHVRNICGTHDIEINFL